MSNDIFLQPNKRLVKPLALFGHGFRFLIEGGDGLLFEMVGQGLAALGNGLVDLATLVDVGQE